ncbi:Mu transposase C-terminal domain-containing protein [Pseudomonas putida]|uniref:Mu transposase C-terminal domain-containing protein n=1 Tax=Pseudomonas putida TaxID=303 RepID=UPI003F2A9C63
MKKSRASYSRDALDAAGVDVRDWEPLRLDAIPEKYRATVERRFGALQAYLTQDATVEEIKAVYGISSSTLYWMLERALKVDGEGELIGYGAALNNMRTSKYKRVVPPDEGGLSAGRGGNAGAFTQLMDQQPELKVLMRSQASRYKPRKDGGAHRIVDLHDLFLKKCRKLGIGDNNYPFNRDDKALRSFEKHLKQLVKEINKAKLAQVAETVSEPELLQISEPLQVIQGDGHCIDLRLTVQEADQYGLIFTYEILRVWIILLVDSFTRCVLGYTLALGKNYDQTDLLRAVYQSIAPHKPPEAVIPSVTYKPQGGFPAEKLPGLAWATGLYVKLDNAMSHHALDVRNKLHNLTGCVVDYGPPHYPNDRAIVESFFNFLVDNFSHRLKGTTGSHPRDEIIKRLNPEGGDLSLLLTLNELHHALDIVISDYNGRQHTGIAPHSPLSLFVQSAEQKAIFFGKLPIESRSLQSFTNKTGLIKVRKDSSSSAYINFMQVRYRNLPVLKNSVGVEVLIEWDPYDISYLKVYDQSGGYLGQIFPPSPWTTPHSEKLRRRLMGAVRKGQINYRPDSLTDMLNDLHSSDGRGRRETATYNLKHTGAVNLPDSTPPHVQAPQVPIERLRRGFITGRSDDE